MSEPKFQMSINLQVLNHLGLNLYSNTSAVLSEVVANAWDADAKEVHISIDSDSITIIDNGTGMDLSDINNKYLTVGYQKRSESGLSPILHRPVMGRKGIGKLSLYLSPFFSNICANFNNDVFSSFISIFVLYISKSFCDTVVASSVPELSLIFPLAASNVLSLLNLVFDCSL